MKLYRIYTQNKNKKFVLKLVSESFPGFTVYEETGFWQGVKEKSLIIEIITSAADAKLKLNRICKAICGYNDQDTILLFEQECKTEIIGVSGVYEEL
jgi:hypothetical protein